jgi:transposase
LSAAQQEQLKTQAATGRFKSAAMAQTFIKDTFGQTFSVSGVRKLLGRLGFSFHKVSSFLFKAKRDKQEAFVKDYEQDKPKVQSDGWRRYFIDGVHPLWGMEVLYYFGAFCPDDHEYLDRRYTDKNLTAQSVIELFELMMSKHPETKHFRIYLDNVRYQHAKVLKAWIFQTKKETGVMFDLKHLPAYSPNLNLIERLWKFMRKEALQSWHDTFEKMHQAVAGVLDNLADYEDKLQTLMTQRFHLTPELSTIVVGQSKA